MPIALIAVSLVSLLASAGDETSHDQQRHWAFQPVVRPIVPDVGPQEAVRNPIDAFLQRPLHERGLSFSPPAEKTDLLRRVKFDLVGLPPTPEEVDEFTAADAPDAYERLVDRLLASPHYGEHWGRMWLDVVRYAETAGYNADPLRPHAWKYRDYVIASFNADTPFDRFVQEQIAGDELFPDDPQAVLATGYLLLWPDESNASNILLARQDALNDLTANVGAAFLGLSIGCAQCHDHKFDPIPQEDFYRLQAFFSGLVRCDQAVIGSTGEIVAYRQALDRWLSDTAPLRDELQRLEVPARAQAASEKRMKFPPVVLEAIDASPETRTSLQRQLAFYSERQIDVKEAEVVALLTEQQRHRRLEVMRELEEWQRRRPQPPRELTGMIASEVDAVPPRTFLLAGGSYNKPLEEVFPGFLSVLRGDGTAATTAAPPHPYTSGRRSLLAFWLTDPANPLVPRVIVNRIWQGHFGRGLVENGNDFGTQTAPPSHPELLDWLASEFVSPSNDGSPPLRKGGQGGALPPAFAAATTETSDPTPAPPLQRGGGEAGWSLKRLHRLIVTSAAYRQSTNRPTVNGVLKNGDSLDPDNRLYWHFPRRRLPAESLRDALLAVCGQLNHTIHGPSVSPELPHEFSKREAWKVSADRADRRRRSVYIHAKRNLPYPLLEAFDLPDMHESCARRTQTTVAPQALMLLNSELLVEYARSFAGRLLLEDPTADATVAARQAYRLAFSREPDPAELDRSVQFLARQELLAAERWSAGEPVLLPHDFPKFLDPPRAAALVDYCQALLNASEFLYVE